MELILATADGRELRRIYEDADIDLGDQDDFELTIPTSAWDGSMRFGCRVYVPGTEYGGIIGETESITGDSVIYVRGHTWRGLLGKKIIEPDTGQDYKTVSGDLNAIIRDQVDGRFGGLFLGSTASTGILKSWQFDRYCTLSDGLQKMLKASGYKLRLSYTQIESGGYVQVSAVPAVDYSDSVEVSQDSRLNFTSRSYKRGTNHLICLGKGELKDRLVVHLYAQKDGSISQTPYYTGAQELVEVFDNSNAEKDDLTEAGTERLKELMNYDLFEVRASDMEDLILDIGDTISGRDYITGTHISKPIVHKILRIQNQRVSVEYRLEGET